MLVLAQLKIYMEQKAEWYLSRYLRVSCKNGQEWRNLELWPIALQLNVSLTSRCAATCWSRWFCVSSQLTQVIKRWLNTTWAGTNAASKSDRCQFDNGENNGTKVGYWPGLAPGNPVKPVGTPAFTVGLNEQASTVWQRLNSINHLDIIFPVAKLAAICLGAFVWTLFPFEPGTEVLFTTAYSSFINHWEAVEALPSKNSSLKVT